MSEELKILNLGLDGSVLDKNSKLAGRIIEYGGLAGIYTVIAPANQEKRVELSKRVIAYGVNRGNKIILLLRIYKLASKLLANEKYNIITIQDQYYLALVGYLLSKKFHIGLELQIHGFEKFSGLRRIISKFVIPRADSVRAVSQRLKRYLVSEFGVKEDKITVAPIYSDVRYQISDIGYNKAMNKFVFLTVGRLVPVKNIEMQIKVMSEVVKQYPNTELWIIGEGEEKEKLKDLCYALRVTRYAKFLGWQEDLEKFYSQANAFLLTSDYEGWGLVVMEAASCGLPIIMTDVGCAGEVIKDGESGIIIPIGDQAKLGESMVKLIKNNELRKKLGENARKAVKNLLSREETLALYKKSWEIALINK